MHSPQNGKKFILVDVVPPTTSREDAQENLTETVSLIHTFGGGSVVKIIQRRAHPHAGTYIGAGKVAEIADIIKTDHIDTVIINGLVTSSQLFNLTRRYWEVNPNIEVWDRVDLILQIFEKHARTSEAKLQIRLAKMRHMGPRMYGLSEELGRQGGGIGGRGVGETNVELMKRHWREQVNQVKRELDKITKNREAQLARRVKQGFKTISIIGYTNAGKTSLFNLLSKKQKKAEDKLFATLDTVVGKIFLPEIKKELLITDTIGFIRDLPPSLIEAFKSTLLESIHADLLLHVIDTSDPRMQEKIRVVQTILSELHIGNKPIIEVYNKADILTQEQIEELQLQGHLLISTTHDAGITKLQSKIVAHFSNPNI